MAEFTPGNNFSIERNRARATRGFVIGPYLTVRKADEPLRSPQARIDEAVGLARAIELSIADARIVALGAVRPATYLGKGKVEEMAAFIKEAEVDLVVMDCALSPVQQRNLEKEFGAKVIDRTGLILEIFGDRARTREGTLQVELAHLSYQKSRLVRSWTHLERQRGGFGFLGGPGETQIESDRRLLQERMSRIERDLEQVKRTRGLHRARRQDVPHPVVALVGYTNAGKSTLFNALTRADVVAQDLLFATLDPTMRAMRLPHGSRVMLSDTVGFISDLPTMLVRAFRATLEEVIEADVILHIRDIAHEDAEAQGEDVERILGELGIDLDNDGRLLEVWNKSDLLDESRQMELRRTSRKGRPGTRPVLVSALTGEGLPTLLDEIEARLSAGRRMLALSLAADDGAGLAWLYENTEVLSRSSAPDGSTLLEVRVGPERVERVTRRFPLAHVHTVQSPAARARQSRAR